MPRGRFTGPPACDRPGPARKDRTSRPFRTGGAVMKLLFAMRNKVAARKSLKASAWYIWY
ncbi:hypothetical protein ELQ87_01805 [Streptomyces griseoviridis]|uniref:Uncharacterized protein n=1 Tax=Streptomyces griseoviridis TaxID=45398 RepID=A0A3S9Z5X9_STRGD|nr:hypothetical protein ELQ87_01805 [Streptomyces griseoviridis]